MALAHNSKLAESEPAWGTIEKTKLPLKAYVWQREGTDSDKKSTWSFPHHHVIGGKADPDTGIFTSGDMYLHRGGLISAWAAAMGARAGQKAEQSVIDHLQEHRVAVGLAEKSFSVLCKELQEFFKPDNE